MSSAAMSPTYEAWNEARAREIATRFVARKGGLMPALQAIQSTFGHVPSSAISVIADVFNLSRAEVHGVVNFYHDFRASVPGRHVLKLCRAEACQAVGGVATAEAAKRHLKLDWGETGADGRWTLEQVFCLGLCASGPSAMVDGKPVGRVDETRVTTLIDEVGE